MLSVEDKSMKALTTDVTRANLSGGRWRGIAIIFALMSLGLVVALVIVIVKNDNSDVLVCKTATKNYGSVNLEDSNHPSVFYHLTETEISGMLKFLYSRPELQLARPQETDTERNMIYMGDLYLPNKTDVINYLDKNGVRPPREAKVILLRGGETVPYIEEIIVGPLPNPTSYRPVSYRSKPIPYIYRPPYSGNEIQMVDIFLKSTIHKKLGPMLKELYDGSLLNCDDKCLSFGDVMYVSPSMTGEERRKAWFSLLQRSEFSPHHFVDLSVLVDIDMKNFTIEKIWFNGELFEHVDDIVEYFSRNKENIQKIVFPRYSSNHFSVLHQRGNAPMDPPLRNPTQVSPDGKRYNIQGRHVEYMFWKFDFRMSALHGPQLYDIRFRDDRIIYELSMQDIAVFYSGYKPRDSMANFMDSIALIGAQSKVLFPGIDCPTDATFIGSTFFVGSFSPYTQKSTFCLFEFNTGTPLRRHHSYFTGNGRFYEGKENVVLVLRTIPTIGVYDYIIDFMFYANGAIEVKVTSTGYVQSTFYTTEENPYSFKLHDNLAATIHHHLFNFKADIDINGLSNRFATLNVETEEVSNKISKNTSSKIVQHKFSTTLKSIETDAAYKYDFNFPKYLLFYNEQNRDKYGNARSYRILNKGMTKQMLPKDSGNEAMVSWSRYQLAVTKYNESERESTSAYSSLDVNDQVVDFQSYIDNDDSIIDEDLVAWITMGHHHIPRTEDLPVTTSIGMDVSFFLMPFNYFEEDAAISSKNAVRVEPEDRIKRGSNLKIERYGVKPGINCIPKKNTYDEYLKQNSREIIDN